jgi:hypothetical protein
MASTRARMMRWTVVAAVLAAGAPAAADEEETQYVDDDGVESAPAATPAPAAAPAPAPALLPPCCTPCPPPPPAEHYVDPERRSALALGWTFFAVGTAISVTHSFSASHTSDRIADLVPIAGPIAGVWHNDEAPAWTAALLFSAWSQAVGALVLALVAADPDGVPEPAPSPGTGLGTSSSKARNFGFALRF